MTTVTDVLSPTGEAEVLRPRPAGFAHDLAAIAGRALRAVPRELEGVLPPVFIAVFFFLVNIATLERVTENVPGFDYTSFQMATAVLLGVTGVSRAPALVLDVQDGYLDRLLLTPVRRSAILVGHMAADVAVAVVLTVPIVALGLALGVRFEGGPLGVLAFVALASLWSLAFAGFGYAIALKTGNPAAVNSTFLLFFPFLFLTSSYVPRDQLSGWLDTVAGLNPVTYLLAALRSLVMGEGWQGGDLAAALLAVAVVGAVSTSLCFAALRGRVARG
ncbi:MAG TPA: ABC transporter permease [Acidimicrobiales bacterium]|nr:ABC transporter permease [Acidimicrobiales bacterium]